MVVGDTWQEVEEREKLVRYMWDLYTHTTTSRLPRFWEEAFEAAYMELASDVPSVRNAAVLEIAKMSLRSIHLHPLPLHSTVCPSLPFLLVSFIFRVFYLFFIIVFYPFS